MYGIEWHAEGQGFKSPILHFQPEVSRLANYRKSVFFMELREKSAEIQSRSFSAGQVNGQLVD